MAVILVGGKLCAEAKGHRQQATSSYDQAVNTTMNMTLLVLTECREQHKKMTWQEIHQEVARRLKVKRIEPWTL